MKKKKQRRYNINVGDTVELECGCVGVVQELLATSGVSDVDDDAKIKLIEWQCTTPSEGDLDITYEPIYKLKKYVLISALNRLEKE